MESTIAAIATPTGAGGVAIIRISGPQAKRVLSRVFSPMPKRARYMGLGEVALQNGGHKLDRALAVYFNAPRSYTGEHVAEIHCHGGARVALSVLGAVLDAGASLAEPGEFTRRAFLNGRMDLSAAEAVMDLIGAQTGAAQRAALRRLEGGLGARVEALQDRLTDLLAHIAATVDYPEEDLEDATRELALEEISALKQGVRALLDGAHTGTLLREGARVALAGRPNVGKSSLFNALLGQERALVADIPGTTRDMIAERSDVCGLPVEFLDLAGIREGGDTIERMGIERARQALSGAHAALLLLDGSQPLSDQDREAANAVKEAGCPAMIVLTKSDLDQQLDASLAQSLLPGSALEVVSSTSGHGLPRLREAIAHLLSALEADGDEALAAGERQMRALADALAALEAAEQAALLGYAPDIMSVDLREAYLSIGRLTGQTADEHVLDRVFERFCLGK